MRDGDYVERIIQPIENKAWQAELKGLLQQVQHAENIEATLADVIEYGKSCVERSMNPSMCLGFWQGGGGLRQMCFRLEEKKQMKADIAQWLALREANYAIALVDTWVAPAQWNGRPSDCPDRTDMLLCCLVLPDGSVDRVLTTRYTRQAETVHWKPATFEREFKQSLLLPWQPRLAIVDEAGKATWGTPLPLAAQELAGLTAASIPITDEEAKRLAAESFVYVSPAATRMIKLTEQEIRQFVSKIRSQ